MDDKQVSIAALAIWAVVGGFMWYGIIWLMMVSLSILETIIK